MRFHTILAATAALGASLVSAQIQPEGNRMGTTYPPVCGNACGPIFIRQRNCEDRRAYDSQDECVCDWDGAKSHIPECQACTRFADSNNDNLRALNHYINECDLQRTTVSGSKPTAMPYAAAGAVAMGLMAAL
ncbi:uncharacterized protein LTR77_005329 [Saxophila tyrrhenica]|uniref:Uncharacterized protein n=1 Tax=Saxophila tyrrhenica TaxID=1690608 RepID=A0AAV9PB72_9PEZI|nr:hypothetical protein LTR77_005329 [Saxophila tyrrhenica]